MKLLGSICAAWLAAFLGTGAALVAQAPGTGSEGGQVVRLSHAEQAAVIRFNGLNANVQVTAGAAGQVTISGLRTRHEAQPAGDEARGMIRLSAGLVNVQEDNNTVTITGSPLQSRSMAIEVPANSSLAIKVRNGSVTVNGVAGDLDVSTDNGRLDLINVGGSIVASTMNGRLEATVTRLDRDKPSSFNSMNGRIDVTLPADLHASLTLRSDRGEVYLDRGYDFKATAAEAGDVAPGRERDGMTALIQERTIRGTIGGGGVAISFRDFNAPIRVHKGR